MTSSSARATRWPSRARSRRIFGAPAYFNGPARFARAGLRYRHWLDGDGMVCALAFGPDGPRLTNRFVRSEKFVREEAAGRPIFRTFGTAFAGDTLRRGVGLESPVNVSVYPFGAALLAFGEQGLPWELDADTLETRGVYTFARQINELTPFSAHPKIDHRTGELFNFGVSFSASMPRHQSVPVPRGRRARVPQAAAPAVSEPRPTTSPSASGTSSCTSARSSCGWRRSFRKAPRSWTRCRGQPELGSHLIVASRDTGEEVARLDVGRNYCLHMVNAFERDGRLVVDVVEYDKPLYPEYQVIPEPVLRHLPRASGAPDDRRRARARSSPRTQLAYANSPDFPAHDPDVTGLPYDHFWMLGMSRAGRAGRKFFDEIVRIDWPTGSSEVFQAPPLHYFGGEPLFVPDPVAPRRRRRSSASCSTRERERSSFVVFDAFRLSAGPVATMRLPSPIPLLFHSSFARRAE